MDRVAVGPVKGLRIAMAAFVLGLVALLCVAALLVFIVTYKSDEGAETHAAVCKLVDDLDRRTDEARDFLVTHPDGLPGIASAAQIRQSLRNQERTRDALSVISC